MDRTIKLFGAIAGILAIFAGFALFSYFGGFQKVLPADKLFSVSGPILVFAIFLILIFDGVYFFNAAGHIIKEAVK